MIVSTRRATHFKSKIQQNKQHPKLKYIWWIKFSIEYLHSDPDTKHLDTTEGKIKHFRPFFLFGECFQVKIRLTSKIHSGEKFMSKKVDRNQIKRDCLLVRIPCNNNNSKTHSKIVCIANTNWFCLLLSSKEFEIPLKPNEDFDFLKVHELYSVSIYLQFRITQTIFRSLFHFFLTFCDLRLAAKKNRN